MPREPLDEGSIAPIEFPPGVFVSARTGEREKKIDALQFVYELPHFTPRGLAVRWAQAAAVFLNGPCDRRAKVIARHAEARLSLRALLINGIDLIGASDQCAGKFLGS